MRRLEPFAPPYEWLVRLIPWSRSNYPESRIDCELGQDRIRQADLGKLRDLEAPRGVHCRCAGCGRRRVRASLDESRCARWDLCHGTRPPRAGSVMRSVRYTSGQC